MFLQWCVFTNVIFSAVRSFWDLDDLLTEYIHYRFEMLNGGGRQGAVNTIYGLRMLLPRLKGQLLTAERCVAHWKRLRPPESYPPLTWGLAVVIAVQMARRGYYRYGVGVLL